jgi:hypothetical protein
MATFQTTEIENGGPARLVKVGLTPKYKEYDPTALAAGDIIEMFLVPGGVRITDGFLKAVGGTGLDTNGAPTLTLKVEITDDAGTTVLLATTSSVRATGTQASFTNTGYLVDSANNDALITVTAVAAAATLGTSKVGVYVEYSSYGDE